MSQEEKSNIISLATTLLITVPYLLYVFQKYQGENLNTDEELKFWATAILIMIPIRIVAEIVMHIVVAIVTAIATGKEDIETIVDERDRLIGLKATRNSFYIFCIGFIFAILAIALDKSVSVMFGILLISGFISELIEISSKIFYYRKGI